MCSHVTRLVTHVTTSAIVLSKNCGKNVTQMKKRIYEGVSIVKGSNSSEKHVNT